MSACSPIVTFRGSRAIASSSVFSSSISLLPLSATFLDLEVGSSESIPFSLINPLGTAATISSVSIVGAGSGQYTVDDSDCSGTIPANDSCRIIVTTSSGGAPAGPFAADLLISGDANGAPFAFIRSFSFSTRAATGGAGIVFRYPTAHVEFLEDYDNNPIEPYDVNTGFSYTFALVDLPDLPDGLTFTQSSGRISGAPTEFGTRSLTVCAVVSGAITANCYGLDLVAAAEKVIPGPLTVNPMLCTATSGTGSSDDPIQLATFSDIDTCLRNYTDRAYILANDIDLTGQTLLPLPSFSGTLDGRGLMISNWTFDEGLTPPGYATDFGLFRYLDTARIKDLVIDQANHTFTALTGSGVLAGTANGSFITGVKITNATLNCQKSCAGLVNGVTDPVSQGGHAAGTPNGFIDRSEVSDSTMTTVLGGWNWSGLLLGYVAGGYHQIMRSQVNNVIYSNSASITGGILGASTSTMWAGVPGTTWIDHCGVEASTVGTGAVAGGIGAYLAGGDAITNSYVRHSTIAGDGSGGDVGIGGFIGTAHAGMYSHVDIVKSYYLGGAITGNSSKAVFYADDYAGFTGTIALVGDVYQTGIAASTTNTGQTVDSDILGYAAASDFQYPANFPGWGDPWILGFPNPTLPF